MQISAENGKKRLGVLATTRLVWSEAGAAGLWANGVVAGNMRALTYQGLRLGLFSPLKLSIMAALGSATAPGSDLALWPRLVAGMVTGGLGALLTSPLDLAKVRMMAQPVEAADTLLGDKRDATGPEPTRFSNSIDCLVGVARAEGLWGGPTGGLWRASGAGVLRAALASSAQLCAYDTAKTLAGTAIGLPPAWAAVVASQVAAVAYTTVRAHLRPGTQLHLCVGADEWPPL